MYEYLGDLLFPSNNSETSPDTCVRFEKEVVHPPNLVLFQGSFLKTAPSTMGGLPFTFSSIRPVLSLGLFLESLHKSAFFQLTTCASVTTINDCQSQPLTPNNNCLAHWELTGYPPDIGVEYPDCLSVI